MPRNDRKRPGRRDPVTDAVWADVRARDGGCIGPRAGLPGPCEGLLEMDHVLNGGMALRGPSVMDNLATLCRGHHRYKTEHAREARRLLVAHIQAAAAGRKG